jgi:hypothetical protein
VRESANTYPFNWLGLELTTTVRIRSAVNELEKDGIRIKGSLTAGEQIETKQDGKDGGQGQERI